MVDRVNFETVTAFIDELEKIAEYAPGIPDKTGFATLPAIVKPVVWQFGVHDHEAKKRGRHFDLRLGDPETGHAHSWAMPPKMPKPGESVTVIQQPTHTVRYMDFKGEIPEGYGAGKVSLHARDKAEVFESSKEHVKFGVYSSSGPQEFTLKRLGGRIWKLFNMTPTSEKLGIDFGKPKYKEIPTEKVDVRDDRYIMSAKVDDAHNLFVLPSAGRRVRVVSYRPRSESRSVGTDLIEHTHKLRDLADVRVPAGLGSTVLRGGVFSIDPRTRKATDAHVLGGLLNSDVWKSREKQKTHGDLRAVVYDVERYRGRDVSKAPYAEKLEILREVARHIPALKLPPMAHTAKEKTRLLEQIESGKLGLTNEGVVLHRLDEHEKPVKAKFRETQDVYVRGFFQAEKGSKYEGKAVGGFTFSHTPDGPVVGRVGSGLSDAQRRDMHLHPEKYQRAVAMVAGARLATGGARHTSGAVRAPSFKGFHPDKNGDRLDTLVL